jgi:hypothetical protein
MIICDLDDTLADARWRMPLWGRWDEFYAEAHLDKPILPLVRMVRSMILCGSRVVIVTAREEKFRPCTVRWLMAYGVNAEEVRMRPNDNFMTSPELKLFLTKDLMPGVELAIDDREDVLLAFRALGVPTLQASYAGGEI